MPSLPQEQLEKLVKEFKSFESNSLDYDKARKVFREYDLDMYDENLFRLLFDSFDEDKDGKVDVGEFAFGLTTLTNGTVFERLRMAFNSADADGDGFLVQDELTELLRKGMQKCSNW